MATMKSGARRKPLARVLVRPPTRPSNGAQVIRNGLDTVARLSRVERIPKQYKVVLNWGNPTPVYGDPLARMINKAEAVRKAIDKLVSLKTMAEAGVRLPPYLTNKPELKKGDVWLARTILNGSGGAGIKVIRSKDEVPDAPLYVKYIPKMTEYRVHVVAGNVIFAQQKKRKSDASQTDDQKLIRNHANGWVFCPVDVGTLTEDVRNVAIAAVAALGLDFGAVDLIVGKSDSLAYALEVNTAPGLESEGLIDAYVRAFTELVRE